MNRDDRRRHADDVAIIGMAGRFPGASNIDELWRNLLNGVESVVPVSDEEWARSLRSHPAFLTNPNLVRARPKLADIDMFDAGFFGFTPRAAQVLDPQQRVFLECAWEALEHAGYDTERYDGRVGVVAGVSPSTYLITQVQHSKELDKVGWLEADFSNRSDSFATRVGYKLNLTGPCYSVQCFCSTSLVGVHIACQNLLNYDSDIVLAGGSTINIPQDAGYVYQEGGILSPDGHTRAFDAKAGGVVFGNGVAIVTLKRLADAIADGDTVYAVIRGTAINNDGSLKVGFTAPSVSGQTAAIEAALRAADVDPETIGYVEAHGTATALGDPAEVAALTKAFRRWTDKKGFCGIGSVKTNIGHLDAAAGVTGLIKAAFTVRLGVIPKTLNFEKPNPQIDFANSPFYVTDTLTEWPSHGHPRRAGVSAMGVGGTNAHAVIEQAPDLPPSDPAAPWQLLVLSARTAAALDRATENLRAHLATHPDQNFADVAYTLEIGRRPFDVRRAIVARDRDDAVAALADATRQVSAKLDRRHGSIAFMFTGQGSQYIDMGRGLYESEPVFRDALDDCSRRLRAHLGFDLVDALYPSDADRERAAERLKQTAVTQPALFAIEYALACLWKSWGVEPAAMIGHSVGEYVAAHFAGVFSLDDALALVAYRGELMQSMPTGAMLSVQLSHDEIGSHLTADVGVAAVNAPSATVLAGSVAGIDRLEQQLTDQGIACRRLQTSHAFHSSSMDAAVEPFRQRVAQLTLHRPSIKFVSNLTGTWITDEQATDPGYWARHLRGAVLFSRGVKQLVESDAMLIEVGPGNTLAALARMHVDPAKPAAIVTSLRHPREVLDDRQFLLASLGKLWLAGVAIDWRRIQGDAKRRRVALPTYPFERQRYWSEVDEEVDQAKAIAKGYSARRRELGDWFYQPSWRRFQPVSLSDRNGHASEAVWLVFVDRVGIGAALLEQLKESGQTAVPVVPVGSTPPPGGFVVDPRNADDYHAVIKALAGRKSAPTHIVHLWGVSEDERELPALDKAAAAQDHGFYSLLYLAQALGREDVKHPIRVAVVTSGMQEVVGGELTAPEKATVLGPCRVVTQEFRNVMCQSVDVELPRANGDAADVARRLVAELSAEVTDQLIAFRNGYRWVYALEPTAIGSPNGHVPIRAKGVYLITGGVGGVGLALAEHLARDYQARLVLTARSPLPPRRDWQTWTDAHGEADGVSRRIRGVEALEALGAEVLVVAADVANLDDMRRAVAEVHERFGAINGVIHAAGVAGGGIAQMKQAQVAAAVLSPKVQGTLVLDAVLQDEPLDFVALCSSTAALAGGFGQVDYAAANAFLDAFAHRAGRKTATVAINWDMWKDVGMGVDTAVSQAMRAAREVSLRMGITTSEGIEAFRRVLAAGLPQAAVVPLDVTPGMLRLRRPIKRFDPEDDGDARKATEAADPAKVATAADGVPALGTDLERTIATIWNEVLGRTPGVNDNFFELGGDSMTAIQVVTLLKGRVGREIPIVKFYEAPTVSLLAKAIGGGEQQDQAAAAAALQSVERRAETRLDMMQRRRRVRSEQPVLGSAS